MTNDQKIQMMKDHFEGLNVDLTIVFSHPRIIAEIRPKQTIGSLVTAGEMLEDLDLVIRRWMHLPYAVMDVKVHPPCVRFTINR